MLEISLPRPSGPRSPSAVPLAQHPRGDHHGPQLGHRHLLLVDAAVGEAAEAAVRVEPDLLRPPELERLLGPGHDGRRILGLDPGEARIGVSLSDPTGTIASATGYLDARSGDVVDEIATAAAEHGCDRVVIGLPLRLDGSEGPAAKRSRALGEAITYMLKHWEKFTLFLRQAGAPLDNNICERALKKAILHRKNSLFYKTLNGAHVGDLYMSLIYTCELCKVNAFDYLTELLRHADQLAANPERWMPWNYRQTTEDLTESAVVVG